jgi:hypothetical protein
MTIRQTQGNAKREPIRKTLKSTDDPRLEDLLPLGGGEGFATFTAVFRGKPALVVDSGTMNEHLPADEQNKEPVSLFMFETVGEREAFVAKQMTTLGL